MRKLYYWDKETQTMIEARPKRTVPKSPYVIQDTMDATEHPADGRIYDSKSEFRRTTRANGCEEVGNDFRGPRKFEPPDVTEDLKRALHEHGVDT